MIKIKQYDIFVFTDISNCEYVTIFFIFWDNKVSKITNWVSEENKKDKTKTFFNKHIIELKCIYEKKNHYVVEIEII